MRNRFLQFVFVALFFTLLCSFALAELDAPANGAQKRGNGISVWVTGPDSAQVGKECTISYAITGGSGKYSDIKLEVDGEVTMPGGVECIDYEIYSLDSNEGTFTFICPTGSVASVYVSCVDDATGEHAYGNISTIILEQNPDYPVTFSYDKETYNLGDNITITYDIGGLGTKLGYTRILWGIGKGNSYADIPVSTQTISATRGSLTYRPSYGDNVRLFLQAEDDKGNNIFGQTKTIYFNTPGEQNPISCEITAPESVQVGKECVISYAFRGGSGRYSDMKFSVIPWGMMNNGGSNIGNSKDYSLEDNSGTFSFICPAGNQVSFLMSCHDDVTGENFSNFSDSILSKQNPDFPVSFTYDKADYFAGDSITITYEIGGEETTLVDSQVLWGIERENYSPDIPVATQAISAKSGSVTYLPTFGQYVKLFLQAKDDKGNIIFGQSKTIWRKPLDSGMAKKLPNSLTRIESEAFAGTGFRAIEIPAYVTYIDEHAFDGCDIRLIVGHSEYARQFALAHDIQYIGK